MKNRRPGQTTRGPPGPFGEANIALLWSKELTGLLIASILLLGAASLMASRSIATLRGGSDWVVHAERVHSQVGRVLQLLTDVETAERGFVISRDEEFLGPYRDAAPELPAAMKNLNDLVADNQDQRAAVGRLAGLVTARVEHAEQVIAHTRNGDLTAARELVAGGNGKRLMDAARKAALDMQSEEDRLLTHRRAAGFRALRNAEVALWTTGGLAMALLVVIALGAVRHGARLRRAERTLATSLRSVGDAVISTDAEGRVQFLNLVAETLTGWSNAEALGKPLEQVFHIVDEQTRNSVESPVAKVLREGRVVGLANHTLLIARDGREAPIEDSGAPIRDGVELVGVVLVFRDATDQRAAERALRSSEQRFRAAIQAVQGILWTNTAEGEMHGEQPGWAALTGQAFDDYQGFGWSKVVHPEDAPATIAAWLTAVGERRMFTFEHRIRRYDGIWREYSVRAIPLLNADGTIREWVGVHTDITEQRVSERRYRAVLETAIDGFMVLESVRDETGRIVDFRWVLANEAAERIIGKPQSWFPGRFLLQEHPGNREHGLFDGYVRVVETGQPWTTEVRYSQDGVDVCLRLIAAKSEDGFAISFTDLTERRRAAERVQERERQFVGLANAMPQLAWTERADGTHEYFNRGWYAYTGLTEEESKSAAAWQQVIDPQDHERTAARWAHSRTSGELYETEFRLRRFDGVYRWFLARAVADRDDAGNVIQWFGTCTDIDTTKRIEESLRKSEVALRAADKRKDVFLATLSHELRNPLAPIRTAASLLENPALGPKDLERSRTIIARQVRHMATLLDDLLEISRITRGIVTLKKEIVLVQGLLAEALESARPLIDERQHCLTLEWPEMPLEIEVDPVRFVQIVANLLTNAAKYTTPGGRITFAARIENAQLVLSVRDTGIGIAPEMLTQVFEMFSQVDPNQAQTGGGLGIGLALVKGLVELHGGHVQARSAGLGQGSEFVIVLPCLASSAARVWSGAGANPEFPARKALRILLADDNRDGADSLAMLLGISGHEVQVAYTGVDALDAAQRHRPNVMILDIGMPGMNGYEVASQIRSEPWGSKIKLIAITGWGQDSDIRRAHRAGFDHHLTKPVDPSALEQLIDEP